MADDTPKPMNPKVEPPKAIPARAPGHNATSSDSNARLAALSLEYNMLAKEREKLQGPMFGIAPVAVTAGGFLLLQSNSGQTAIGAAILLAVLVTSLWLCHWAAVLNYLNLGLVRLEGEINRNCGFGDSEGLIWFTRDTAEGLDRNLAFKWSSGFVGFLSVVLAVVASYVFWCGLCYEQGVPDWACDLSLAALWLFEAAVALATVLGMRRATAQELDILNTQGRSLPKGPVNQ